MTADNTKIPTNYPKNHLLESAEILKKVSESCSDQVTAAALEIARTFKEGGKLLLCGNGGSAADCQHMATEFVSRLSKDFERPGLPALALTTDTSFLTAFTNDCGYEYVFARQVTVFGKPEDILLGISTSGTSLNVIRALDAAREANMRTILLTSTLNPITDKCDVVIAVPATNTQYIQEAHLAIEHTICEIVERILFC
ncbi:MAG: D-sedoheptulose-7-phosphate isomerase [Anaerolineaceae bacterium]